MDEINSIKVDYFGGLAGALLPPLVFISGVITLSLMGAPDERGFWPILILSLCLGLILAKDKRAFSESLLAGMSQPVVMIMIMAWILASIIGVLMGLTGFVEALTWGASELKLGHAMFVVAVFFVCVLVSVSTGSSFGTILICGPLLFPAGGLLGVHLATLAGAIIGGATFGDCIAPVSDTTIASAISQDADIGGTVKTRLKYVLPAGAIAIVMYAISAGMRSGELLHLPPEMKANPLALIMIIVPLVIIYLLLNKGHLFHGLFAGLIVGVITALTFGLLPPEKLLSLDLNNFRATSFIIDGINRAVGISFFTILLMGLVSSIKASGLLERLANFSSEKIESARQAEAWILGSTGLIVLFTAHSVVAVLTASEFVRQAGERMNINKYRRANLMGLIVCTFPFILPYFIPVILMSGTTLSGADFNIATVSPLEVGLHNFLSWSLMMVTLFAVVSGYGRDSLPKDALQSEDVS
jgi:Na+/H+ antiporter NhaC